MNATIEEMSTQELEQLLRDKRKKELKQREAAKAEYEKDRDNKVKHLITEARSIHSQMEIFKQLCHQLMNEQETKLTEYGGIRSNSKGGFSITDSDQQFRVTRRRDTEPVWDERGQKAIVLIKEFLHDTVKKRDMKLFEILLSFLEKNKAGDLEYGRVFSLMKHRDKFDDQRWIEGLRLLEESFSHHLKGYGYEFKIKGNDEKWHTLLLNFSSI